MERRKVEVLATWNGVDGEKKGNTIYLERGTWREKREYCSVYLERSKWREEREYYLPGEE